MKSPADALVLFGITGDLAYKKTFPALQAMVRRGLLQVPILGVAKQGWSLERLRERMRDSLREHGLVQPIVVRGREGRYQLIAGQRRLAAARRLGWEKVPVRVLDVDDRQMAEIAIVENLQRRDLDALEKAASFKQYLATWGCTQEELAKRLSIDRSHVANLIRLLELPEAVQSRQIGRAHV